MTDAAYMRLALELAERGRATARPNPMVGAVAVQGGHILGQGHHPGPGQPHAEVFALDPVPDGAQDVTLYVTLEPCCHTGRTPPCTDLLIRKGIGRVVCAMVDPDPKVSGHGIARLRDAGIQVDVGLMEDEARRLNEVYVVHRASGLPFVTLKLAQTLDGYIAAPSGDSRWISSGASRARAHGLRADADAVLVGSRTVQIDDPELSVRHVGGRNPVKIVLDSRLGVSAGAKVFRGSPLILATTEGASEARRRELESAGARIWRVPDAEGRPRLREVLARAASEDLMHVLIEGGSEVAASALREGLVHRLAVFIAPKLLGGGIRAVNGLGVSRVADALPLGEIEVERFEDDVFYTARVAGHTA
jgi:diaminohydroxyphosphoribosylaminopyrimidine deaminase/5-amino-6-(5-phosphoribosylamino)uracil reductase